MNDSNPCVLGANREQAGSALMQWQGLKHSSTATREDAPGIDNIGASKSPVVFGDGAYWMTRCVMMMTLTCRSFVKHPDSRKGLVGLRMFVRYGGALLLHRRRFTCSFRSSAQTTRKTSSRWLRHSG